MDTLRTGNDTVDSVKAETLSSHIQERYNMYIVVFKMKQRWWVRLSAQVFFFFLCEGISARVLVRGY